MATFADALKDLQRLERVVAKNKHKYQTAASNEVGSRIRKRIHNRGLSSSGRKIGEYSEAYAKQRKKGVNIKGEIFKGLQTSFVDLQVSGDLMRGLQTGKSGSNIVLGIAGTDQVNKALWLEEKYGDIYEPSKSEERAGEIVGLKLIDRDVKRAVR